MKTTLNAETLKATKVQRFGNRGIRANVIASSFLLAGTFVYIAENSLSTPQLIEVSKCSISFSGGYRIIGVAVEVY